MPLKIFLSAATKQFKACRDALASDLRAVGAEVKVQEDFTQLGGTLLEKLEQYIDECDRVIALVGDYYGFGPEPAAMPSGAPRRSYTQWEYFLATGGRLKGAEAPPRETFVYFATPEFLALNPVEQPAEERDLQRAFAEVIKASGKDRGAFSGIDGLRAQVLRDGFELADRQAPPNNLPYTSIGTLFKGRTKELAQLRAQLGTAGSGRPMVVAAFGLGGTGKTRLATEYGWLNQLEYPAGMYFVRADSPENLHQHLAALAGPLVLNLPEREAREEDVRVGAVLRWLAARGDWYLVLDNADSPDAAKAVEDILPRLTKGDVVITSRLTQWSAAIGAMELDVLGEEEAAAFLLDRTEPAGPASPGRKRTADDAGQAKKLAHALGGLALALEQAGAYIAERRVSLAEYRRSWEAHDRRAQEWHNEQVMKYARSVAATWETTLEHLDAGQVALLRIFAHFAPDPIPLFVLDTDEATTAWRAALTVGEGPAVGSGNVPASPRDAVPALARYSMVKWDAERDAVSVHRVVQEIIRMRLTPAERDAALRASLAILAAARPRGDPGDVRTWPRWTALRPHVERVAKEADDTGIPEPTADLYGALDQLLDGMGLHREAEHFSRRALAIDEASHGPDHPRVAIRLNNLALLLQGTNRLAEAEPLVRRALAIDEANYGPDHPSVAIRLNNLALLLQATNRLAEAEPLMRRALAIGEASHGPDHPKVAIRLNNLALLLKSTSRLAEAEPLMRRALAIDEASYGPEHPSVATRLSNLASLLLDTNRLTEAEPLMRRALAIDEASYGPDHPSVAICLSNLASLLQATNRLAEAEPLMRRALAIGEASYDPNHPSVAIRLSNLASLLQATNRLAEAEPLMLRHLRIFLSFTRHTGHEHPHLRDALANYGGLLDAMGWSRSAIAERLRVLLAEYAVQLDDRS